MVTTYKYDVVFGLLVAPITLHLTGFEPSTFCFAISSHQICAKIGLLYF